MSISNKQKVAELLKTLSPEEKKNLLKELRSNKMKSTQNLKTFEEVVDKDLQLPKEIQVSYEYKEKEGKVIVANLYHKDEQ